MQWQIGRLTQAEALFMICSHQRAAMNTLLKPSETDDADAIASAAVVAIEELRSRLEQAEQVVSYGFTRGEFVTRPRL